MTDSDKREQQLQDLDARINARGFQIDIDFARAAADIDLTLKRIMTDRLAEMTGERERDRILQWLSAKTGETVASASADVLRELSARHQEVERVCGALVSTAITSTGKYRKMLECADPDGRIRNAFIYSGAHTGRWTSQGIQAHNLPRTDDRYLHLRPCVKANDGEWWYMLYGNSARAILSTLVRTAITAPEGRCLHVADFSAIEARVLAWMAGETWKMRVFREGGKIYEETASRMFGIPVDEIEKGSPARDAGKITELALGFGGGYEALIKMAAKYGIKWERDDAKQLVDMWRYVNPHIVSFWQALEEAARKTMETGTPAYVFGSRIRMESEGEDLRVTLPSGRALRYRRFKASPMSYVSETTSSRVRIYGGKMAENIVQAVARDILAEAMIRLDSEGHEIIMHTHDEVVVESSNFEALPEIIRLMKVPPIWAEGLSLDADGYTGDFYKK